MRKGVRNSRPLSCGPKGKPVQKGVKDNACIVDAPRDIPILRDELCTQEFDFDLDKLVLEGESAN